MHGVSVEIADSSVHSYLIDVLKMILADKIIEQWERRQWEKTKLPECSVCGLEAGQFVKVPGSKREVCFRCARREADYVERREKALGKLLDNPLMKSFGFVKTRKKKK
ncbi:MAG: hypothetical protein Q8P23_00905 [bacterium]|nr:hypothetical protein [bacterium]